MVKRLRPARDFLEYLLFRTIQGTVRALPLGAACGLGRSLGHLGYLLDRRHRRIAVQNITQALDLPDGSADARRIARACFQHLGQVAVEFALLPRTLTRGNGFMAMEVENMEVIRELLPRKGGIILVTGHTGNWELLGAFMCSQILPLSVVVRTFRNPLLEKYIRTRRESYGQRLIPKKGALLKAARLLQNGQAMAFLMDQHAGRSQPKIDFMGRPAFTYSAPGALAVRFRLPMLAGFCYRVGKEPRFKMYFEEPIYPDPDQDSRREVLRLTRYANEAIGKFVKTHPEQWLWMHRRWRE